MATDIKKLAEELVNMTVLEVNELKTVLKDEYGIEPVAAVAVAAGGADAGAAADDYSRCCLCHRCQSLACRSTPLGH